jgi:hypothetical protein
MQNLTKIEEMFIDYLWHVNASIDTFLWHNE